MFTYINFLSQTSLDDKPDFLHLVLIISCSCLFPFGLSQSWGLFIFSYPFVPIALLLSSPASNPGAKQQSSSFLSLVSQALPDWICFLYFHLHMVLFRPHTISLPSVMWNLFPTTLWIVFLDKIGPALPSPSLVFSSVYVTLFINNNVCGRHLPYKRKPQIIGAAIFHQP